MNEMVILGDFFLENMTPYFFVHFGFIPNTIKDQLFKGQRPNMLPYAQTSMSKFCEVQKKS